MRQSARIKKLDDFKWVAALLVVANHISPLESLSATADFVLTRVLARVAVPFFFMVTGYFVLYGAMQEGGTNRIWAALRRMGRMYAAVTILYLPVILYKVVREGSPFPGLVGRLLRAVVFDGTYYHLWYLPASMSGLLIARMLLRYLKRGAVPAAALLYAVGLLGDSYCGIAAQAPLIRQIYEGMFRIFSYTRNGIFFAPLFLIAGYETAVWSRSAKPDREEAAHMRMRFLFCLVLMCGEGLILHAFGVQRHDSMYLVLPVCMVCLFRYLLTAQGTPGKQSIFYLEGPMIVYFVHPLIILAVRGFVKVTKLTFLLSVSPVYYLTVLAGSLIAAYLWLWGKQNVKKRLKEPDRRCI